MSINVSSSSAQIKTCLLQLQYLHHTPFCLLHHTHQMPVLQRDDDLTKDKPSKKTQLKASSSDQIYAEVTLNF